MLVHPKLTFHTITGCIGLFYLSIASNAIRMHRSALGHVDIHGDDVKYRETPSIAPEFVVDLRRPPEERWLEVVSYFKIPMRKVFTEMLAEILPALGDIGDFATSQLTSWTYPAHLKSEVCAIARGVGVKCGHLRLIQLAYELHAACTSVGAVLSDSPKLFRSMDWDLGSLQLLTANFHFIGGELNFTATSWAGYIGVLTGVRAAGENSDAIAVSVNFRRKAEDLLSFDVIWKKVTHMATHSEPVGFLLRRVLGSRKYASYEKALDEMSHRRLIAPVYFTMTGIRPVVKELLRKYEEDYDANYDTSEIKCCCESVASTLTSVVPTCALISKSDFQEVRDFPFLKPSQQCPIMGVNSSINAGQLVENKAGCTVQPKVIAPCALQPMEIAVITRRYGGFEEIRRLTATSTEQGCKPTHVGRNFLVQTNHDQFAPIIDGEPRSPDGASQDIFASLQRKVIADKYLSKHPLSGDQGIAASNASEFAFNVLSLPKIMNSHTVYGTFMDPADGTLETRLPGKCLRSQRKKRSRHCGDARGTFSFRNVWAW